MSTEQGIILWDKGKTLDLFRSSISKAKYSWKQTFFCNKCLSLVTKLCSSDKRLPNSTLIETFYLNVA